MKKITGTFLKAFAALEAFLFFLWTAHYGFVDGGERFLEATAQIAPSALALYSLIFIAAFILHPKKSDRLAVRKERERLAAQEWLDENDADLPVLARAEEVPTKEKASIVLSLLPSAGKPPRDIIIPQPRQAAMACQDPQPYRAPIKKAA